MTYKRQFILLSFFVAAAVMSATATVKSFAHLRPAEKSLPKVEEKYTSFDSAAYILMEQDGFVAIYTPNPTRLVERTAISVTGLRQADRQLLQKGITADSEQELLRLLEDFNS